jgi:replication initiation and membrane attachment protein DnaB
MRTYFCLPEFKFWGRLRRIEHKLDRLFELVQYLENTMADNDSVILSKLNALAAQVAQHTTDEGNKLAAAVAAARAAQQKEDKAAADAEMAAALTKIDEISRGLVEFSPSGN